jgi:hypothetical protein
VVVGSRDGLQWNPQLLEVPSKPRTGLEERAEVRLAGGSEGVPPEVLQGIGSRVGVAGSVHDGVVGYPELTAGHRGDAAEQIRGLEHQNPGAVVGRCTCRDKSRSPRADDRNVVVLRLGTHRLSFR